MNADNSTLQKALARRLESPSIGGELDGDAVDDLGAFGWLRGVKERAIMLELRKKSGALVGIGYGWIDKVAFDPAKGITLHAMGQEVLIRGRNLNTEIRTGARLLGGILRHRVPWIIEADRTAALQADSNAVVIEEIVV